jgi:uncharacterized protein (TIGR03118 family)
MRTTRIFAAATLALLVSPLHATADSAFRETDLVSDQPNVAKHMDARLVNAWGLAFLPTGPFWVADNGTGSLTLYVSNGDAFPTQPSPPLVVSVPTPGGSGTARPTGMVANTTPDFVVSASGASGPSLFLAATEDGTIVGWSPNVSLTQAVIAYQSPSGAIYKGLALAADGGANLLFATDFHNGVVDVFDAHFGLVRSFTDPDLPENFAPFGIAAIDGKLYVTFAKQELPDREDDEPGPGNGFVDVFDLHGKRLARFASRGPLDSPWGVAVAPKEFGRFGGALLVGNFGDGHVLAYDRRTRQLLGALRDDHCRPIEIDGLWALAFGNDFLAGEPDILYFTAGPEDESHGLFGKIKVAKASCDGHGDGHERD